MQPLQPADGDARRYVFCRQRQDDSLRRGAEQHSLVLLSEHPYSSVLVPLCQVRTPSLQSPCRAAVACRVWPSQPKLRSKLSGG